MDKDTKQMIFSFLAAAGGAAVGVLSIFTSFFIIDRNKKQITPKKK
jgi:hypothetical protein